MGGGGAEVYVEHADSDHHAERHQDHREQQILNNNQSINDRNQSIKNSTFPNKRVPDKIFLHNVFCILFS